MNEKEQLIHRRVVFFNLDDVMLALPLERVLRVVHAVFITPLPGSPPVIVGIINVQGMIVPVFDIRKRFELPPKEVTPDDSFIILKANGKAVAIIADEVHGISETGLNDLVAKGDLIARSKYINGIIKTDSGMVFIHDPDLFLSDEENLVLMEAMASVNKTEGR